MYLRKNVDLSSFFVQRSSNDNFSARAGHLISTNPNGCGSLGSITKPSGDAPIQFDCKYCVKLVQELGTFNLCIPDNQCGNLFFPLMPVGSETCGDIHHTNH